MALTSFYDVPAPAKLNLFLHVIGRRADGYHLLQSAFVLIDWCDTLHFELRRDAHLQRHDLGAALPEDDLCLRAARALQRESGTPWGADISIDKQVPWGAGMGGGSSDAASTLLALNRLWGLNWPRSRLLSIALNLGADVPFFVGGRNAWVEGIGEILTPITLSPHWLAVIKPGASIATEHIFKSPLLVRNTAPATISGFSTGEFPAENVDGLWNGFGRNDLQPPAQAQCSEVVRVAHFLQSAYGNSRMTGSGSAVFATVGQIVAETNDAEGLSAATALEAMPPEWTGRMCRSLVRHPLNGWAHD